MDLKVDLKKVLYCGGSLLMVVGIGAEVSQVSNVSIEANAAHTKRVVHIKPANKRASQKSTMLGQINYYGMKARHANHWSKVFKANRARFSKELRHTTRKQRARKHQLRRWIKNDNKKINRAKRNARSYQAKHNKVVRELDKVEAKFKHHKGVLYWK